MTETTANSNRVWLSIWENLVIKHKEAKRKFRFAGNIWIEITPDFTDCSVFAALRPSFSPLRVSFASLLLPSHPSRLSWLRYQRSCTRTESGRGRRQARSG